MPRPYFPTYLQRIVASSQSRQNDIEIALTTSIAITFDLTYDGSPFGNSATGTGFVTFYDTILPNPSFLTDGISAFRVHVSTCVMPLDEITNSAMRIKPVNFPFVRVILLNLRCMIAKVTIVVGDVNRNSVESQSENGYFTPKLSSDQT